VYACGGGGGSQQREVADGADVVFTDTGLYLYLYQYTARPILVLMQRVRERAQESCYEQD